MTPTLSQRLNTLARTTGSALITASLALSPRDALSYDNDNDNGRDSDADSACAAGPTPGSAGEKR